MASLLARERPDDGVVGEEGANARGASARTWMLDPLDGTLNFASGLRDYCCAAALVAREEPLAAAVLDPVGGALATAAAGEGAHGPAGPLRTAGPARLAHAIVATFADSQRRGGAAILGGLTALARSAGTLRMTGSGTLQLSWLAMGRLHAWAQPDVAPWDWHPGALLVVEAGGAVGAVERSGVPWRIAAASEALLAELAAALRD